MTPVSPRYLAALLGLLLLAAVPVAAHYVYGLERDDCAHPERLREVEVESARVHEEVTVEYAPDVVQYTTGAFSGGAEFRWVRTLTGRRVYGYRPRWVPGPRIHAPRTLHRVEVDGTELPIHGWVGDYFGQPRLAMYLLMHRGRPVENAFRATLAASLDQLLHGPTPIDFVGVHGIGARDDPGAAVDAVNQWLGEAWRFRQRACGGG